MTGLVSVLVVPWTVCSYAGWLTFVLPALAWQQARR